MRKEIVQRHEAEIDKKLKKYAKKRGLKIIQRYKTFPTPAPQGLMPRVHENVRAILQDPITTELFHIWYAGPTWRKH
jgi:hypothetical protein